MKRNITFYILSILILSIFDLNAQEPTQDKFWSKARIGLTVLHTSTTGFDLWTTRRGLKIGLHEANPILRPLVDRGAIGQIGVVGFSLGIDLGVSYLIHRITKKDSSWRMLKWEMPLSLSASHTIVGVYNYRLVNKLR